MLRILSRFDLAKTILGVSCSSKHRLKCRGLKQAGKREDLLARVSDSLKNGNHHILAFSINNGKWLETKLLRERNAKSLKSRTQTVTDVPQIPKTGYIGRYSHPSQDLPSLFNYGHVYHMLLNRCRLCQGN